jgi:hypothetical protein
VSGAVPGNARLGWSSVVNPALNLAYICFFPGNAAVSGESGDIILRFNDLWMQYGGRPYTPWSPWDGAPDQTYCLGMGNTIGAWAFGLDYARNIKRVLGLPATVTIRAGAEKTLYYGCLFAPYERRILDSGIVGIDAEESRLVCKSATEFWKFDADPSFTALRHIKTKIL